MVDESDVEVHEEEGDNLSEDGEVNDDNDSDSEDSDESEDEEVGYCNNIKTSFANF